MPGHEGVGHEQKLWIETLIENVQLDFPVGVRFIPNLNIKKRQRSSIEKAQNHIGM